jgi:hypothetical protein
MDISNVGSLISASKFPTRGNDGDGDDKGGAKVGSGSAGAQGVTAQEAQKSETARPTTPVAKSGPEDTIVQTKTPGNARLDVTA